MMVRSKTEMSMTEQIPPFQPLEDDEPGYDWDYDDEQAPGPQILWGRVAALAGAVLIAFLIGRMSAPDGVPQEQLDAAIAARDAATEQVGELQNDLKQTNQEMADLQADLEEAQAADTGFEEEDDPILEDETADIVGKKYVVEEGDTLRMIDEEFYGDVTLDDCLAAVNGIADPSLVSVGETLIIPKECTL